MRDCRTAPEGSWEKSAPRRSPGLKVAKFFVYGREKSKKDYVDAQSGRIRRRCKRGGAGATFAIVHTTLGAWTE